MVKCDMGIHSFSNSASKLCNCPKCRRYPTAQHQNYHNCRMEPKTNAAFLCSFSHFHTTSLFYNKVYNFLFQSKFRNDCWYFYYNGFSKEKCCTQQLFDYFYHSYLNYWNVKYYLYFFAVKTEKLPAETTCSDRQLRRRMDSCKILLFYNLIYWRALALCGHSYTQQCSDSRRDIAFPNDTIRIAFL